MRDTLKQLLQPNVEIASKLAAISMFIGKMFERHDERITDLEARQLQKGDKGERGERGVQGAKGDRGEPGKDGAIGPVGPAGKDGKAGKTGKDGVSVVSAEVALDNHLVFKLSDGKLIDAGELPAADEAIRTFVAGNAWQITVSDTAPANPQLNALWLDIS